MNLEKSINEFAAEIITKTGQKIVLRDEQNNKYWIVNKGGKFMYDPKSPNKMPASMQKNVIAVLKKIGPNTLVKAYGLDKAPAFDIATKGNNVIVTDDNNKSWSMPLAY